MDIDKLTRKRSAYRQTIRFGSLMDIDKLTRKRSAYRQTIRFGSLMDIDKLTLTFLKLQFMLAFWFSDGY